MAKCHPAAVAAVLARSHWKWRSIGDTQFVATALPYCDSPRAVELTARIPRRDLRQGVYDPIGGGGQVTATVNVPCRKCAKCLHWRSMQWSERAMKECLDLQSIFVLGDQFVRGSNAPTMALPDATDFQKAYPLETDIQNLFVDDADDVMADGTATLSITGRQALSTIT